MLGPVCVLLVHTYWFADSFRAEGHSQRGKFTILSGWQWHEWRKPVRLWRMNSGTCRETRIRLSLLCWHCISGLGCWGTVFVCMCGLWFYSLDCWDFICFSSVSCPTVLCVNLHFMCQACHSIAWIPVPTAASLMSGSSLCTSLPSAQYWPGCGVDVI